MSKINLIESFEKTRIAGSIAAGALDEVAKIIKLTKINLNIGLIFITLPSIKNCLRYLKTLK